MLRPRLARWIAGRVVDRLSHRPSRRPRRRCGFAADTLEQRTLLAAITATADTTDYTLQDGDRLYVNDGYNADLNVTFKGDGRVFVADGAAVVNGVFQADTNGSLGTTRVNFQGGSTANLITYNGAGGNDGVIIEDGAVVGNVILDASSDQGRSDAASVLLVAEGGVTGDIVHLGSRGVDRLYVRGTVATGRVDANLGRGNDEVRFYRTALVRSSGPRSPSQPPVNRPEIAAARHHEDAKDKDEQRIAVIDLAKVVGQPQQIEPQASNHNRTCPREETDAAQEQGRFPDNLHDVEQPDVRHRQGKGHEEPGR